MVVSLSGRGKRGTLRIHTEEFINPPVSKPRRTSDWARESDPLSPPELLLEERQEIYASPPADQHTRAPLPIPSLRSSHPASQVAVGQHVHVHVRHGLARELAVLHAELEAARLVPG